MATFPDSVYSPRTKENKPGVEYDEEKTTVGFAEDVTKLDDEIVALETFILTTLPQISDEDLVLYLPFNEANGEIAKDASKHGNDGKFKGPGEPAWTEGKRGSAVDFDGGDDYIEIPDSDDFSFGSGGPGSDVAFSLSAWVYMDDATSFYIASKYATGNREYRLGTTSSNKITFVLFDESANAYIGRYFNTVLTAYEGQWIHLVFTYDGSGTVGGIKIYLNSKRIDDANLTSGSYVAMENLTQPLYIGRYLTTYADGKIDELRVFRRELSAAEIKIRYLFDQIYGTPAFYNHFGDRAGGNYAKFLSDGELNLFGTARIINHVIIPAESFKLPGLKPATEGQEGNFITLDFVHTAEKEAFASGFIPFRWDSDTDVEISIDWLCDDDGTGGDVVWGIEYLARKDNEEVGAAGVTITQAFTGAGAGLLQRDTFTTKLLKANLEADDIIGIRIFRDHDAAGDTLDKTARFLSFHLHFIRNKLGEAT